MLNEILLRLAVLLSVRLYVRMVDSPQMKVLKVSIAILNTSGCTQRIQELRTRRRRVGQKNSLKPFHDLNLKKESVKPSRDLCEASIKRRTQSVLQILNYFNNLKLQAKKPYYLYIKIFCHVFSIKLCVIVQSNVLIKNSLTS